MAKRDPLATGAEKALSKGSSVHKITPGFAHLLTPEHKRQIEEYVGGRMPTLVPGGKAPREMRKLAKSILQRSHGVVCSSMMALSTAITAMKANGGFDDESHELTLMQAVLRYSEQNQVPPSVVMQLIADDELGVDEARPD
jgi:hypothetical protein